MLAQVADDVNVAQNVAFVIIAVPMVLAALLVVTTKNVVHAALWLVVVLGGIAAQYILAAAEFVAVSQVLVYIGAVMVLFLFGIMLTRAQIGKEFGLNNRGWAIGIPVAVVLLGLLTWVIVDAYEDTKLPEQEGADPDRPRSPTRCSRRTWCRSSGSRSSSSPPPSARWSWPGRTDPCSRRIRPCPRSGRDLCQQLRRIPPRSPFGTIPAQMGERTDVFAVNFLLLGAVLFCIGVFGVIARRNAVMVLMSVELILNAVNLNLIAFALMNGNVDGQVFALYVIAVAAAEVGVGLAMVLLVYRNRRSIALDELSEMKG